jgi:hypothetical protein
VRQKSESVERKEIERKKYGEKK